MELNEVNVLVVDDVNTMRIYVRDLLKTFGFNKIHVASSGEEAKQLMTAQGPIHLILSDWRMEPTDGLNFLGFVRGNPQTSQIPFIMVTADGAKESVITAIKSGVDDYIVKPITVNQIQLKVLQLLIKKKVIG